MSKGTKYLIVSLPNSISPSKDRDEALTALRAAISTDNGNTSPFRVPTFKVGTLDALVTQADDLAKLTADAEAVTARVAESLGNLLEGDQEKIAQQKNINDKPVDQYLQNFSWNKVKYRIDKPIAEILEALKKELIGTDNDVKQKFNQYNNTKRDLVNAQKKQTGNLSTKSLITVVHPNDVVSDSEYLETHLIAVPKQLTKDFIKTYESLSPMIVPRSAKQLDSDDEYVLYGVTTFKKHAAEFVHKCREKRWIPRDFRYQEDGEEKEKKEVEKLEKEERKLWGEALRLGRTGYSEAASSWMHALALRVFVETILRYGLPPEFVAGIVKTTPKAAKKAKQNLDSTYSYLGGNAVARDKKGRMTKDDLSANDMAQAGQEHQGEYTPYVFFEFEVA